MTVRSWYEVLQPFTWHSYSGREADQDLEEGDVIQVDAATAEPLLRDGKIKPVSFRRALGQRVITNAAHPLPKRDKN
jgi:hypothetical protein